MCPKILDTDSEREILTFNILTFFPVIMDIRGRKYILVPASVQLFNEDCLQIDIDYNTIRTTRLPNWVGSIKSEQPPKLAGQILVRKNTSFKPFHERAQLPY